MLLLVGCYDFLPEFLPEFLPYEDHYFFERDIYTSQIVKVELRYSERTSKPKIINIDNDTTPVFHISDSFLIETLDEDDIRVFCADLSHIPFIPTNKSVDRPFGFIVIMHLYNNNFIVLSLSRNNDDYCSIFAEFDSEEKFVKCFGFLDTDSYYFDIMCRYFKSYNITSFYDL